MGLRQRGTAAVRRWDEWVGRRVRRRPGRTLRLLALALLLVVLSTLPEVRDVHDGLWAAWSLMLTGFVAIAPKGFYDGRFERWTREHNRLSSLLMIGFTVFLGLVLLSDRFGVRRSLLIAGGLGLVLGLLSLTDVRKSRRHADEGPASEVDDEPSSRV